MSDPLTLARMAGSSIVAPGGALLATDFLNAAFYARAASERTVDDLRLAHGILATRWASKGRRVGARDLPAFNAAFGAERLRRLGRLDRATLLSGGAQLLGDWFPEAWDDPARRAYGVAFETAAARRAFDPAKRLAHARLGRLTAPRKAPEEQEWSTYPAVALPDPDAALRLLEQPARWPDFSSAAGRFVPLRRGGLEGQTFEISLALSPLSRNLVTTRGYVTCTAFATGRRAAPALAELATGAEPLAYVELTTHHGHFMGRAISRVIAYADAGGAHVRDVGSWDPLPPHMRAAYAAGGHAAQVAFWGPDDAEASMLAQLARVSAG